MQTIDFGLGSSSESVVDDPRQGGRHDLSRKYVQNFSRKAVECRAVPMRLVRYSQLIDAVRNINEAFSLLISRSCAVAKVVWPQKSNSCAGANRRRSHSPSGRALKKNRFGEIVVLCNSQVPGRPAASLQVRERQLGSGKKAGGEGIDLMHSHA